MGFLGKKSEEPFRLTALPPDITEARLIAAVPVIVRILVAAVQKESIRLYRRVHSHDAVSYRAVRDEFFFLSLYAIEACLEGVFRPAGGQGFIAALRADLSGELSGIDRDFRREPFLAVAEERCREYRAAALPSEPTIPAIMISAGPLFGRHLCRHLDDHPETRVMHVSGQVLQDLAAHL